MAGTLDARNPSQVSVRNLSQNQQSITTGTYYNQVSVSIPLAASAGTIISWINPESGTVIANAFMVFSTTGTGTMDLGVSDDGTGIATDMVNGGTMNRTFIRPAVIVGTVLATSTLGIIDGTQYALIGPGGTGTNNSITASFNEAATSTAVGALIVQYTRI